MKQRALYTLGIHTGHDAGACLFKGKQLVAFCKEERITRKKHDGGFSNLKSIEEVLRIAGISHADIYILALSRTQLPLQCFKKTSKPLRDLSRKLRGVKRDRNLIKEIIFFKEKEESSLVSFDKIKEFYGLSKQCKITFTNHHYSHTLGAYNFTDWKQDALYISCDGGGDGATYSAYYYDGNELHILYGGDETLLNSQNHAASIGVAYAQVTELCGFTPVRHEGKITGLAAFGQPVAGEAIKKYFSVNNDGSITSQLANVSELKQHLTSLLKDLSREDMAASIQYATEELIIEWIKVLIDKTSAKYIGMSGGVFANVRLNQRVAELEGINEVFIFPAMRDEGLPVGNAINAIALHYGFDQLERNRMGNVYLGFPYTGTDLITEAQAFNLTVESSNPAQKAAKLLQEGRVGAIYSQRMEMGPRALGARTILASPVDRDINDSINKRLERTEFMPFVLEEDASKVFEVNEKNAEACLYMTITTNVKKEYHDKIPAVVHVDGTARPQIIKRTTNPLYFDILSEFKTISGLPCLVNTSFNAHEEPIINTPTEALKALNDNRVDFLVCEDGIIFGPHFLDHTSI
ncbi:carbamoyltransferase C-terminal domain-containing protein [Spartinivicinus ruber]|uniref:carbamoyltransferase C-terminal domain-containing protein n=1 Tax=Spartinivicinus ruber TaxID=2683272 RepID=UPI0013D397AC|nr:carbamoyltransferase C-terminal domain-containing protein [Spartinivicinus ruber]